jgi:hypothetical protein
VVVLWPRAWEGPDLPLDSGGIEVFVGVGEDCFVVLVDDIVGGCPPVRGLRLVVLLGHLRVVADLGPV